MFKKFTSDQRTMLWVLTLINLLNYLDRQVIFPLFSHIKIEFGLTDFHLGVLGTVFLLVQSLATFPMGLLADRISRKLIVGVGVAVWSLATFGSGLVQSFKGLLGMRSIVGVGEAAYAPAAVAMITDNFPDESNARIQGIFNVGMLVGGTLGAIVGGLIAFYFNDWRLALFIVSVPGIILAFFAFRLKDKRVEHDEPKIPLKSLIKNPAYIWIIISGTLISFASGAFITWGIEFISRYKDYNIRDASLVLGIGMMISSVVGVLIGSYIADWLHKKYAWGRSIVVAISLIISAPLMYLGLADTNRFMFLVFFFSGAIFLAVYLGPVTAVLHDIVPKQFRASAFALYVLFIHLVGEAFSPAIIGVLSDKYNLRTGLEFATLFVLLAGICFLPVVYITARDHKRKLNAQKEDALIIL
jgi:MFS family permease